MRAKSNPAAVRPQAKSDPTPVGIGHNPTGRFTSAAARRYCPAASNRGLRRAWAKLANLHLRDTGDVDEAIKLANKEIDVKNLWCEGICAEQEDIPRTLASVPGAREYVKEKLPEYFIETFGEWR